MFAAAFIIIFCVNQSVFPFVPVRKAIYVGWFGSACLNVLLRFHIEGLHDRYVEIGFAISSWSNIFCFL